MPTVPNRYYNSPYIAAAAQNLSEALFGSPERELQSLQAQKIRAEMAHTTELDRIAAEDRARAQTGMTDLSDAFKAVQYDERGNPTPESLNALAARAALIPGANPINLIAPYGRTYGIGLQQAGAGERVEAQQTGATERTEMQQAGADVRNKRTVGATVRGQDVRATTADEDRAARERMNDKVVSQRAVAAATRQGRQPVVIQGRVLTDIKRGVDAAIEAGGTPMPPETRAELIAMIGEDVQTTRNVPASIQRMWAKVSRQTGSRFAGSMGDVLRQIGLDPQKEYLSVGADGAAPASDLGDVLAPSAEGAPPPAAAPAAPTGGAPVQIRSAEEWQRLPPGTRYIDPNGVPRTKQ